MAGAEGIRRVFDAVESLSFRGVWKYYGGRRALGPCDLEVAGGETLAVVGPSGSGKTTLLRMVNRLVEPDRGAVTINGTDVREWDPVRLRRGIGYAIQQIGLFPHMTVAENVGLVLSLDGTPRREVEDRVAELLALVRMPAGEFAGRYPRELSGGQQQRVGLARALALDPPLLLMDEPFGALDPLLRAGLQEEFLALKRGLQTTVMLVTHDLDEAFRLGDRVAVVHEGCVLSVAAPDELILDPGIGAVLSLGGRSRYLEHMRVRALAARVDGWPVLDAGLPARQALEELSRLRSPRALVADGAGVDRRRRRPGPRLAGPDSTLGELAGALPRVSSGESVPRALAVVAESGKGVRTGGRGRRDHRGVLSLRRAGRSHWRIRRDRRRARALGGAGDGRADARAPGDVRGGAGHRGPGGGRQRRPALPPPARGRSGLRGAERGRDHSRARPPRPPRPARGHRGAGGHRGLHPLLAPPGHPLHLHRALARPPGVPSRWARLSGCGRGRCSDMCASRSRCRS